MAKTLSEIKLFAKTVVGQEPWIHDPNCLPIPWRPIEPKKTLKIAVLWNDGKVTPTPPVARALKETVEKLKSAGHEIVDWEPTGHQAAVDILARKFLADGAKSIRTLIKPTEEPFRPEMKDYEDSSEIGVYELWQIHLERNALQKDYLERWNSCEGLDAILGETFFTCPPFSLSD